MKRTWTYTGNISSFAQQKNLRGEMIINEIELYDIQDDSKAPVLLHVSPSLMGYILNLEWNDDEERYMRKEFVYDNILSIREIRVLNKDGQRCKIIREPDDPQALFAWTAEIVGPVERITDEEQRALTGNEPALLVAPEVFNH